MTIKKLLGNNITWYRKQKKLTQEQFSELLNISPNHLSNIEQGKKFISSHLLEKVAEILQVSPYLLFFSNEEIKSEDNDLIKITKIIDLHIKHFSDRLKNEILNESL